MPISCELAPAFPYDFELFGLVCRAKEYRLAWYLNHHLKLNLAKSHDLTIDFVHSSSIVVSNFTYQTSHCTFKLLKNACLHQDSAYLLPELKNMDYFLMIKNESDTFDINFCWNGLSEIKLLDNFDKIQIDQLTNKENLIF